MQFEAAKTFILQKLSDELPSHFTFHSLEHAMDVYSAADHIADAEGLNGEAKKLLLTAAAYHDTGFLITMPGHEEHSCDFAREYLPEFGYNNSQLEKICGMIMATKLPQKPHNLSEKILCDADLDYLGRDDFFTTGDKLYNEFLLYGVVNNEEEWNRLQLRFLEAHNYFTNTSKKLRSAKKNQNLELLRKKLNNSGTND